MGGMVHGAFASRASGQAGPRRSCRGFTIIEMVVAIVIAAIMAAGIVSYIGDSVEGFSSSANRNKLASSGRTVVDRLALELHNAVPNSIRVTTAVQPGGNQCLEMLPFLGATTYLNPAFTGSGSSRFEVINFNPSLRMEAAADLGVDNVYAVIYPINTVDLYAGLSTAGPGSIVEVGKLRDTYDNDPTPPTDVCTDPLVDMIADAEGRTTVCLADGPDVDTDPDAFRFSLRSPVQRLYLATNPVSFCVVDDKIYRYKNYGFHEDQCDPDTAACLPDNAVDGRDLITDRLDNDTLDAFSLIAQSLRRNAIISLNLNFTDQGDVITLQHEVLMRNVP
jgi:MSHA biogenesis protein MshO